MAKGVEVEVEAEKPYMTEAKLARQTIFADSKPKTAKVTFRGVDLELRQPSVTEFLNAQSNPEGEERSASKATIRMIVQFAYLEGTNDRVFEPSDVGVLEEMPMSGEFFRLIQAMNDLLDIKVEEQVKN